MKLLAQTFIILLLITAHRTQAELVAHWPLDGNAKDLLGNHNGSESGVIFGVEGAANHTGTAAEFNGSSSTITVPFDSAMNPESFTLSMWVNADSTSGFASPVTSRDDTPTSVHGYLVYNDSSGNWNFWTGTGGPSGAWNQMSGGKVEIGSWAHIAVSYDDGSQTKKLYVNGSLAGSNSAPNLYSPNGPQSENLHIGSGADSGGAFFFDGLIDDVALWDHALTSAEIKDLMTNGVPGGPPSITIFEASPPFIDSGQNVTLSWDIKNATSVSISPSVGSVAADRRNIVVAPTETTTYTITAIGESSPAATSQVTVGVDVESLTPIITEFLADNKTGLIAPDGNRSDWIELHNPNPFAIEIGGWHLSDDSAELEKFTFPPGQIPAGGYKIFFADSSPEALNFKLAKTSDYLALSDPNGNIISEFSPAYPAQFNDVSYGISNSGTLTHLEPTPGVANGSSRSEIGPKVKGLTRNPLPPTPSEDLLISANITPRIGDVASSKLFYRVGFGTEQQVTMTASADGQYSATIPASAYEAGEMVRWYLIATTTSGESTREPPFPDLTESAQYFGTVISDPSISVDQPVMHWFVRNSGAADTRGGTRGSLYFEGHFHDNIFCRIRGQSTANWPKHKYKFDFYRGDHFRWKPDAKRVEEINVNSHYRDSYVRENTIFAFLNEAGAMAPETRYLWIKRNGSDLGLFTFVEQVDEEFLERRGVDPTGSMYKAINVPATLSPTVNSSLYRKVLRKNEPYTELRELTSGINISNPNRFDFVADAVNIPNYINVMAAMCVPFNHDQLTKNYYVYHDLDRGEWFRIAWDGDQGLPTGRTNGNENWSSPLYGDALHTQELVGGNPNPIWQNHLHAAILDNPVTRQMYMRRVRTLIDKYLKIPEPGPSTTLLAEGAIASYFVPLDSSLESTWFTPGFNDTTWPTGPAGFGYENNLADYQNLIHTRVKPSETIAGATSIYQRYDFNVTNPASFQNLVLRMRYEDGFIAYLNGREVARSNISGTVRYNSTAGSNPDSQAVNFENFPLFGVSLLNGSNNLAIQVINQSVRSSDLLCEPELIDQPGSNGGYFENLLAGFRSEIENDVIIDQSIWSGSGITNFSGGFNGVLNTSLPNRRTALFDTYGPDGSGLIPDSQPVDAIVSFSQIEAKPDSGNQDEEFIEITNTNRDAVDISDWTVSGGINFILPPGAVVPGNSSIFLSPNVRDFRLRGSSPTGGEGNIVIGDYYGHLSNFTETLTLTNTAGVVIAQTNTPNQASGAQRFLVISEIMYHPADGGGTEFIELLNISEDAPLNLEGVSFSGGINFTFPAGTVLSPGAQIIINENDFLNDTSLSNGGELIKLEDAASGTIKEFTFDDKSPWPTSPDGGGRSLVLINPHTNPDPNIAGNWRSSTSNGGNPGNSDSSNFTGDPNGDTNQNGVPDLIDYTLGAGGSAEMTPKKFSYRRKLGTDDVNVLIEASPDLSVWAAADSFLLNLTTTDIGDGFELVEYDLSPAAPTQRLFLRVRAELISL
ncbi:MAG: hypothetical protein ACJAT3_001144 [Akkermansiaceae bacterium]|jgi:hypothetical protein